MGNRSLKLGALLVALSACRRTPEPVRLAAAISLQQPLEAVSAELAASGTAVSVSFGASGDLARQVREGAPIALFASASETAAEPLVASGLARRACTLARNSLALIESRDHAPLGLSWTTLGSTPALHHFAIGAARVVPAGDYAETALQKLGVLDALRPKLVRGSNVRQVLELVARGEAEAGIVYATDARGRSDVSVLGPPPVPLDIRYPLLEIGPPSQASSAVRDALCGPLGRAALWSAGFLPP